MRETINEEVSVVMYYSAKKRLAMPRLISWQNKDYTVDEVDYKHPVTEGKTLFHIFEFVDAQHSMWFRLKFNTSNLHWTLEAISDGNAN